MSNRCTQLCRPVAVSPAQKSVLMCLADRADDNGAAWPSIPSICEWTCLKRTAVIDALKALEARGLIAAVRACGKNSRFQLDLAALEVASAPSPDKANQSAKRTSTADGPVRETDPTSTGNGLVPVRQTDYTRPANGPEASRSINEASGSTTTEAGKPGSKPLKTRTKAAAVPELLQLPPGLPEGTEAAWRDFVEMRKAIRKPLTEPGVRTLVRRLQGFEAQGHDPKSIIEESVANSWQGLFPPKERANARPRVDARGPLLDSDDVFTGAYA